MLFSECVSLRVVQREQLMLRIIFVCDLPNFEYSLILQCSFSSLQGKSSKIFRFASTLQKEEFCMNKDIETLNIFHLNVNIYTKYIKMLFILDSL